MQAEEPFITTRRGRTLNSARWGQNDPAPSSVLLDKIHDQQIYLTITNTLLKRAQEAGTPKETLEIVAGSMLRAKGIFPKQFQNHQKLALL